METILFDLKDLSDSSQKELNAYRNIGSIRTLRRLRRQEKRRIKRMKRAFAVLKGLIVGACLAVEIWAFVSWIDIVLHNTRPDPIYQAWNLFTLLF